MKSDVVIIGGGIVGCSAAFYLAKRGLNTVLLEKDPAPGLQGSGRNAGGVRQQGRRGALPLAMAAVELWADLAGELACELEYIRTGNLSLALDQETEARLEAGVQWEQAHGLDSVRMVTAEECHALVPGLSDQVIAGKHCATDGAANPMIVMHAFSSAVRRAGADIRTGITAQALLRQGSKICGVATDQGEVQADVVINAAGPWAPKFNAMAGCSTPISPGRSQLIITERVPPSFKPFFSVPERGYMRQTLAGNIVIGLGGVQNDDFVQHVDYESLKKLTGSMQAVLPRLKEISMIRSFAGITEYTPDGEPYIGPISGVQGLYVAAGFHGQGFCVGPMAGKIIAGLINGDGSPVSLDPFRPDRFDQTPPTAADSSTDYPGDTLYKKDT